MPSHTQPSGLPRATQLSLLDACRGGAALWVVMAHACLAYIANGHSELLSNPVYAFSVQGQIGVGFFFVISGYCILATIFNGLLRGSTIWEYLAARCKRIYPPYVAALGCVVLTHLVVLLLMSKGFMPGARPPESPFDHGMGYWLTNLVLVQLPAGHASFLFVSWSLCYEIAFYVLAGGLWAISSFIGKVGGRLVLLVTMLNFCSLLSVVWVLAFKSTCPFPLDRWYQFGLGVAMFVLVNREKMQMSRLLQTQSIAVILAVFVLALNSVQEMAPGLFYSEQTMVFYVLGFVVVVIALSRFDHVLAGGWLAVQFRKLGAISYSLYLVHMIPIPFVDAALRRAGFQESLYLFNFAAQTATAVIAGMVFHRLVEKRFFETKKRRIEAAPLQCQPTL